MTPGDSTTDAAPLLAAVFAPAFLRRLDRLRLTVRRSLGTRPGNTPMPRGAQGSGIEIESHKSYGAGDDLRHLDWNAYGRLDELLIKTFRAEREAPLQLILDVSGSMATPSGDAKFATALALAASLAYISLRNHDPVRIVAIGERLPQHHLASRVYRHRGALPDLRDFLLQLQPRGATRLDAGIAAALRDQRMPGVALLLSDFLVEPAVSEGALAHLHARGFTVGALRLLGPAERDPSRLFRRAQVVDAETGAARFVTLTAANLARYEAALASHLQHLQHSCHARDMVFAVADTAAGLDDVLFRELPARGLLH